MFDLTLNLLQKVTKAENLLEHVVYNSRVCVHHVDIIVISISYAEYLEIVAKRF